MRASFLLLALESLAGCVSYSSYKEARALEPGSIRFDVVPTLTIARPKIGATAFLNGSRPSPNDTTEQPHDNPGVEVQLRYGIARGFDLGVKGSLSSVEANATIEVLRGRSFEVALAPAAQIALGTNFDDEGWEIALFKLPVLLGIRFGDDGRNALVLGPTLAKSVGGGTMKNSGYPADALFAGGTIGLSLQAGSNFRVFPEIAIYTPLSGHGVALPGHIVRVSPDIGPGKPVIFQAGIGFSFGSGTSAR